MKCRECGGKMKVARETVKYDASGLPGVTLLNVEVRRCPQCGEWALVLPKLEELHRVLALAVVRKPAPLAREEIRFLRKHMGWSAADFARHMGKSPETISRWETGKMAMGATADRLLRMMVVLREKAAYEYSLDLLATIQPKRTTRPLKVGLTLSDSGWSEQRTGTDG
jgi:putative zinc finger/helix-turn-helix YgiT family protein